jgi:hypothetical protein
VRGSRTQALVATHYQSLWPAATSTGAGASGRDVLNVPVSIEVKARRAFNPLAWIRQARKEVRPAEDTLPPHVVMRPDKIGEENIGDFIVLRRLADDTEILRELLELRAKVAGDGQDA